MSRGRGELGGVGEDYQMPLIPHTSTPNGLHRKVRRQTTFTNTKKTQIQIQKNIERNTKTDEQPQ